MKRFQQNRKALGSQAFLTLVTEDESRAQKLFNDLWRIIDEFEDRFSRFKESSETSKFNNKAGSYMTVSEQFKDLLFACKTLAEASGGLFNPFILPNLQRAGYVGSWPTPSKYNEGVDFRDRLALPSYEKIIISGNQARIPINSALDFGGIGKGYLLDQLSLYLDKHGETRYWLSMGGDIICNGLDVDGQPWFIKIQHATEADELVGVITNDGKKIAIATSGVTKRKGKDWHHIIDPRTGESAETDILNVSVVASDAKSADVFAKCLLVVGTKSASEFVKGHRLKGVYIQTSTGKVHRLGAKIKAL